jgi:hypothetical protein
VRALRRSSLPRGIIPALVGAVLLLALGFVVLRLLDVADVEDAAEVVEDGGGSGSQPPVSSVPGALVVSPKGDDAGRGTQASPYRTIGQALTVARGGQQISVAPGSYPAIRDAKDHGRTVRIIGVGTPRPQIAGAEFAGARRVAVTRVTFTEPVVIRGDPVQDYARPSTRISIENSRFRTSGSDDVTDSCLTIRDAAAFISILRSRLSGCPSGVIGPGNSPEPHSHHIRIEETLIENVPADAIQFGEWDHVTLNRNVIRHMRDPAGEIHNDGVQFVGDSRHVRVTNNRIYDSGGQLVFIQDAFGPIDDVLVANNLIYGSDAIAIQNQGATNTRYLYNTVWDTRYGALLLREGEQGTVPTDTVVVGNILESLEVSEGAGTRARGYNLIADAKSGRAADELIGVAPGFRAPGRGDYRLRSTGPAVDRGERRWAPKRDLAGRPRGARASLGAFEPLP